MSTEWCDYAESYQKSFSMAIRPFCMEIISVLDIKNGETILNIGCGTGSFEITLIENIHLGNIPKDVKIHATDYSDEMIRRTIEYLSVFSPLYSNLVKAFKADGESLQGLEDSSYDIVVSSLGIAVFRDRNKAMRNVYRVLKPNGQFVFNLWETSEVGIGVIDLVYFIFDSFPNQKQTRRPSNESNAVRMKTSLECIGFRNVSSFTSFHSIHFRSLEVLWQWLLDFSPKVSKPLKELSSEDYGIVKSKVFGKIKEAEYSGGFVLHNRAITFNAYK
jgi:ubiquinone/menaquinone biosynthesis C-methylase UbiE